MYRLFFALSALCVFPAVASATIMGNQRQVVDFTQPDQAAESSTWSSPKHLGCTKEGFGWDGDKRSSCDGWIETKPLAIGTAWRPTQNAGIRVKIEANYPAVVSTSHSSKTFYAPSVYVRYSADRVHWSDWQPTDLKEDPNAPGTVLYTTRVGVSRRASQAYRERFQQWSRRDDVEWASDEHEFCRWLVSHDRDFFAKQRPFVGYVQFLLEGSFKGSQRLTRFEADVSWSVGGMHQFATSAAAKKRQNSRAGWGFVGDQKPGDGITE